MKRVVETIVGIAVIGVALLLLFQENRPSELLIAGMFIGGGFFVSKSLIIDLIATAADHLPRKK